MSQAPIRVLLFVIAYHAEATLRSVLERIPHEVFATYDCEILVVDDASEDRTLEVGIEYRNEHPEVPITAVRNAYNQGYGGNQKVGYEYAITEGFNVVAMIHGDGQYAPEELPRLLDPVVSGQADAVFGSRMLEPGSARKGGMPMYKYLGNRALTTAQNTLLRTKFSEFHSGYRVYSVAALTRVHYRLNSNDFHFDTEIILQLLNAECRILELPIPTYYGDEICRVNGIKYAANVMLATVSNVFHTAGLLQQRRLDPKIEDNRHYELKLGYPSTHSWALAAVPPVARVIDIGSGPGGMAAELVKKGCATAVVDQYPPESPDPNIEVFVQDLDDPLLFDCAKYDYLLLLDVIEHLKSPETFLARVRDQVGHEPRRLILTTPNIAFFVQRFMLLGGQFNYGKSGILDRTHTRLFTFRTLKHLLRDAGFRVLTIRGVPVPFPLAIGNKGVARFLLAVNMWLIRISPTMFAYQIYVEAESTPSIKFTLSDSRKRVQ